MQKVKRNVNKGIDYLAGNTKAQKAKAKQVEREHEFERTQRQQEIDRFEEKVKNATKTQPEYLKRAARQREIDDFDKKVLKARRRGVVL